jgi:hypothetical protein
MRPESPPEAPELKPDVEMRQRLLLEITRLDELIQRNPSMFIDRGQPDSPAAAVAYASSMWRTYLTKVVATKRQSEGP